MYVTNLMKLCDLLFQIFFIQGFLFEYVVPAIRRLRGPIHKYEKLHAKLDADDKWPPVGRYEVASVRGKVLPS